LSVAGSISSVTRADEETQDDVFADLETGGRHGNAVAKGGGAAPAKQMRQVSHLMNLHTCYVLDANEMIRMQTHA
jgi:hypothetical protein